MGWSRILLGVNALAWVGFGTWGLMDPQGMLEAVHVAGDASTWIEIRAMYGGTQLGLAAFLLWCFSNADRTRVGLVAATLTLAGLGTIRLLSAMMFGPPVEILWWMAATEVTGTVVNVATLLRTPR